MALISTLALLPVAVNTYAGSRADDCAHPEALASDREPLDEWREKMVLRALSSFAWREGTIEGGPGEPELHYSILRSYDPKRLYYRPDYSMIRRLMPRSRELEWVELDGVRLPVHVPIYPWSGRQGALRHYGAYILIYGGEPVAHPIANQLLAAPRQMFVGSQPMTLMFVWARARPAAGEATEARLRSWLFEGWQRYQQICES
jgi:hypothetical protein